VVWLIKTAVTRPKTIISMYRSMMMPLSWTVFFSDSGREKESADQ